MTAALHLGALISSYADTVYGVPGFPVNGLLEDTKAELVINEKVALEYALGDALSGKRSCVIVKHVGMNVLSDTLVHATAQGLKSGVVVIAGDDSIASGTQTVQDSRLYGPIALVPVVGLNYPDPVRRAYAASERWSRVALIRYEPGDLTKTWVRSSSDEKGDDPGSLADPDLTMYGRAYRAYESVPEMTEAGYVPFAPVPLIEGEYPKSRTKRGSSRTFCPDCPFRWVFDHLQERGMPVIADTGCSLLSTYPPYSFGIANYGLGSSPGVASRSTGIALTGDYAILHSGIAALIDLHAKDRPLLCIILQNRCMGTTGHQPVPEIMDYIGFTNPVVCNADEHERLKTLIRQEETLKVLVIQGTCPEERCV